MGLFNRPEKVWDNIAPLWFERKKLKTQIVEKFLKGSRGNVLDLGCGSGRNFVKIPGVIYGVDFSQKMLNLAKKQAEYIGVKVKLSKAKAYKLPFKDNFFDKAIFIAVLHCIGWKLRRKQAVKELYRVLKPGARAIITVWDENSPRLKGKSKKGKLSWIVDGKKEWRDYYLYDYEELAKLVESVGFTIIKRVETRNNIIVIVEKS